MFSVDADATETGYEILSKGLPYTAREIAEVIKN